MKKPQAIKYLFISLCFLLVFTACKKKSKEETTVNFHLFNPVSNEPYVGVKLKIREQKDVSANWFVLTKEYENKTIWEGETDGNGKASYTFKAYNTN